MQHPGTQTLETERLILRRYRSSDAEDIFANWASDAEAARFWSWEPHRDISTTKALLEQWIRGYDDPATYHWAIEHKISGQAIGYIYLNAVNEAERSAAVHYLLSRWYWNQGLMSEACRRVIDFALHEAGFRRIESWHHRDNPASGKVMQKCGMTLVRMEYKAMECERLSGEYCFYQLISE